MQTRVPQVKKFVSGTSFLPNTDVFTNENFLYERGSVYFILGRKCCRFRSPWAQHFKKAKPETVRVWSKEGVIDQEGTELRSWGSLWLFKSILRESRVQASFMSREEKMGSGCRLTGSRHLGTPSVRARLWNLYISLSPVQLIPADLSQS